jgi:hypothetical protein
MSSFSHVQLSVKTKTHKEIDQIVAMFASPAGLCSEIRIAKSCFGSKSFPGEKLLG